MPAYSTLSLPLGARRQVLDIMFGCGHGIESSFPVVFSDSHHCEPPRCLRSWLRRPAASVTYHREQPLQQGAQAALSRGVGLLVARVLDKPQLRVDVDRRLIVLAGRSRPRRRSPRPAHRAPRRWCRPPHSRGRRMVGMGEDVAHAGDAVLGRDHVRARRGDQLARPAARRRRCPGSPGKGANPVPPPIRYSVVQPVNVLRRQPNRTALHRAGTPPR